MWLCICVNVKIIVRNIQFTGDKEMITVEDKEIIRRAYYVEHKSIRQIQTEVPPYKWAPDVP